MSRVLNRIIYSMLILTSILIALSMELTALNIIFISLSIIISAFGLYLTFKRNSKR